jgi:sialate O-acetylesterase
MKVDGDKIKLTFKHVDGGLTIGAPPPIHPDMTQAKPDSKLKGFQVAGEDKHFVWADATIDGDTVVVSSPTVKNPVAVRYAWANNPECNLYNKSNLPASPFRTDNWEEPAAPAKAAK